MDTYVHGDMGLRVQWDKKEKFYLAEGRMRDFVEYVEAKPEDCHEPWEPNTASLSYTAKSREEYIERPEDHEWAWAWANGNRAEGNVADTWDEVKTLASEGWAGGVERIADMANELRSAVPETEDITPRYIWTDQGDEYDIHRTWSGEFEKMFYGRDETVAPGPRIVNLVAPVGGHAGQGDEALFWLGATTLVLADVLERAGYRVGIKGYTATMHSRGISSCGVNLLKTPDQHVQLAAIATAMCLPVYFRAVGFRWKGRAPYDIGSGWGSPAYAEKDAKLQKHMEREGVLDSESILVHEVRNKEDCIKEVRRIIKIIEAMRPRVAA